MQRMNQLSLKSNFSANEIYTRFVTSRFTVIMHHTCHDVFVIKNTTHPDSSQYLSKFVGKNTNFRNDAGQSLERKEGKKVSLFLRVEERLVETRARKGWTRFGFSTNFPAALRITRFTSEREQRGCWRVSWLGGSRVIINTGSREEKCQQGKKTFFCGRGSKCTSLRTSVQSRRRGGGGEGGGNSKLGRRRVRGNSVVRTSRKPYPFRREITIEKRGSVLLLVRLIFFNRLSGRAMFAQTLERILNSPEWKIQRISLERDSLLLSSSFERISSHDFISEEREKFEFERHKRLERESSRIDTFWEGFLRLYMYIW